MKKLLIILILLPLFSMAQTFVSMNVETLHSIKPAVGNVSFGYQFQSHVVAEAAMHVTLLNKAEYPAYFLAQGGYLFRLSDDCSLMPIAGFGYKLLSTDDSRRNGIAWMAAARITHNVFTVNAGLLDHKLFISIGLTGLFEKENNY